MRNNKFSLFTISLVILLSVALTPQRASAQLLELAFLIDGSSSIDAGGWALQVGAYQSVFNNDFYDTYIASSGFDEIAVAAYVFSGGSSVTYDPDGMGPDPEVTYEIVISSFVPWTTISSNTDSDAAAFAAAVGALEQPANTTRTGPAIDIVVNGGPVGCPSPAVLGGLPPCSPEVDSPPFNFNAPGILNNGIDGQKMIIDISTDGNPTNQDGQLTPQARQDAITAANNARSNDITVNAIGVDDAISLDFLEDLTTPDGFFTTAADFTVFELRLEDKIFAEINPIPVPPAVWLFGSGLLGLLGMARRRKAA